MKFNIKSIDTDTLKLTDLDDGNTVVTDEKTFADGTYTIDTSLMTDGTTAGVKGTGGGTDAGTGATGTGKSNSALSVSSIAVTATLPLRIVGIIDDAANSDLTAAGYPLLVRLNAHFNAATRGFASQTTADSTGI